MGVWRGFLDLEVDADVWFSGGERKMMGFFADRVWGYYFVVGMCVTLYGVLWPGLVQFLYLA